MDKLLITKERSVLLEGRRTGLAFSFLKKVGDNLFETISPFSTCKDYLNDVIYTEKTGKPLTACGFETKEKHDILVHDYIYLGITCLGHIRTNTTYQLTYHTDLIRSLADDIKFINDNPNRLLDLIKIFEEYIPKSISKTPPSIVPIKLVEKHIDIPKDNPVFLVSLNSYWGRSGQLISLASLLLRLALQYDGSNIYDFLHKQREDKFNTEQERTFYKLLEFLKRCELSLVKEQQFIYMEHQDYTQYEKTPSMYHNLGFLNF